MFSVLLQGQAIPENIEKSIRIGNARELARYFNSNIELVVENHEDVYSKSQAEVILKDFFSKNKPKKFKVVHKGGEKSKFVIGSLETEEKKFRVYFFLKSRDGKSLIHQLRIEPDNE